MLFGPLLLLFVPFTVFGERLSQEECSDIDHNACVVMASQNAKMCSDPVLAATACPVYCNKCPTRLTCYNCSFSNPNANTCKTVSCQTDEVCMVREIKPTFNGSTTYNVGCEKKLVCDGQKKRSIHSRSVYIDCCLTDLCNLPSSSIPTTTSRLSTLKTTSTTDRGHWSEWSNWGFCTSSSSGGYKERRRTCNITHTFDLSASTCINGSTEYYRAPCSNPCSPPQIVNLTLSGSWTVGGMVILHCEVSGDPKPSISWMARSSNVLTNGNKWK
ncbi:uncharacterized protein LOC132752893 isoform X2 [Ruditapes philippinarum]|uniref:uncharacterized protein LOC132752893 isoform X2 n=1 Tax=Ruditapes philippinarum TaxID=129788 RepID=UPI00295AECCE|nr:uncharacterized protein LOC132752893 isoform X2 [Ruditapes philippinarum]